VNLETRDGASRFLEQIDGYAPTPDQLDVIMGGPEPALVIAGAGAGKTKTMALRVVYHVAAGHVQPGETLGLTFTKKAANELSARVSSMLWTAARLGSTALDEETAILSRPQVLTYNSFASDIASEHGLLVGVDPSSRLITEAERFQIVNDIVLGWRGPRPNELQAPSTLIKHVMGLSAEILDNQLTTDDVRASISDFARHITSLEYSRMPKNKQGRLAGFDERLEQRLFILDMVDAYLDYKKVNRLTEFADQVAVAYKVLRARPQLVEQYRNEHKLVLLDEYQDTSVNQAAFLAELFGAGHDVTAVGDPNQAIYGWRGASADALSAFKLTFNEPGRRVSEYSLSMAFRNRGEILDVANTVAAPLRRHAEKSGLTVRPLEAFTPTGGEVDIFFDVLKEESYAAIAADIDRYRREHAEMNDGRGPSVAVLCRARSAFEPMAKALDELGIPVVQHGNQSAITQPEAKTIRGLLRAVATPGRGDELVRVIAYLNIAPADIEAVNSVRRRLSRERDHDMSFVEALDHLDRADLTDSGRQRLETLTGWLTALTEARFSRIEDLIGLAETLTGLDTEVASRSVQGGVGRAALSILQRMAAAYSDAVEGAALESFLAWLDLVEEHERDGEGTMPLADLAVQSGEVTDDELEDPNTVTIMTVHGAKGLEWDYVAIPNLRYGGFDLLTTKPRDPWIAHTGKIPQWLRADAGSLPAWRWQDSADAESLLEGFLAWDEEAMAEHENREVRRLAYVAMTRPRARLLLAGYWYEDGERGAKKYKSHLAKPDAPVQGPSRLLLRLDVPVTGASIDTYPEVVGDLVDESTGARWLADLDRGATDHMVDAARRVASRDPLTMDEAAALVADRSPWLRDTLADLVALLDTDEADTIELGHVTANGVVAMADNPDAFRLSLVRPIPTEPALAARLGQQVHEYIALQYSAPRTGDLIDVSGQVEQVLGLDTADPAVAPLLDAFENLDLVRDGVRPIAIEAPVDVTVAGVPMRGTIDAVFEDGTDDRGDDRVRIVDWKTGRRPSDTDLESRELQLHLYRYAWSKVTGMKPENIRASFAYLGEKDPDRRIHDVPQLDTDALEKRVAGLIAQVLATR